jgi:hypothetical protein
LVEDLGTPRTVHVDECRYTDPVEHRGERGRVSSNPTSSELIGQVVVRVHGGDHRSFAAAVRYDESRGRPREHAGFGHRRVLYVADA